MAYDKCLQTASGNLFLNMSDARETAICILVANIYEPCQEVTVMTLSFRTDRSGQTVQTQIRLLPEQSDQGLHCFPFASF